MINTPGRGNRWKFVSFHWRDVRWNLVEGRIWHYVILFIRFSHKVTFLGAFLDRVVFVALERNNFNHLVVSGVEDLLDFRNFDNFVIFMLLRIIGDFGSAMFDRRPFAFLLYRNVGNDLGVIFVILDCVESGSNSLHLCLLCCIVSRFY